VRILLVIRYSFDEFRRILVEEKTFIDSKEPIIPEIELFIIKSKTKHNYLTNNNKNYTRIKSKHFTDFC